MDGAFRYSSDVTELMIVEITQMKHVDAKIIASKTPFSLFLYLYVLDLIASKKILENIILIDY